MLGNIIFWTALVGLIGVGGAWISLRLYSGSEHRLLLGVAFAAGGLIGASFLDLLPEAFYQFAALEKMFLFVLAGFVIFFLMDRMIVWRHCHEPGCNQHASSSLIITGGTLHNILDGVAVAASFLASVPVGIATSLAIMFHEIPHEMGDFGVLLHNGYTKKKAFIVNLLSALAAVLGGILGFYFLDHFRVFIPYLLSLTGGGFLYVGASDLLPRTHQVEKRSELVARTSVFLLGIIILWVLGIVVKE